MSSPNESLIANATMFFLSLLVRRLKTKKSAQVKIPGRFLLHCSAAWLRLIVESEGTTGISIM